MLPLTVSFPRSSSPAYGEAVRLARQGAYQAESEGREYRLRRHAPPDPGRDGPGGGACDVKQGIPMKALDEAVLDAVRGGIVETSGAPGALLDALEAHRVSAAEAQAAGRADVEREGVRLEKEIGNLVAACAAGTVPEIAGAIAERRVRLEALRAAPAPAPIDRRAVFNAWEKLRLFWLNAKYPAQVRQLLRRLGITSITFRRAADGARWEWEFGGLADVAPMVAIACPGLRVPPIATGGISPWALRFFGTVPAPPDHRRRERAAVLV